MAEKVTDVEMRELLEGISHLLQTERVQKEAFTTVAPILDPLNPPKATYQDREDISGQQFQDDIRRKRNDQEFYMGLREEFDRFLQNMARKNNEEESAPVVNNQVPSHSDNLPTAVPVAEASKNQSPDKPQDHPWFFKHFQAKGDTFKERREFAQNVIGGVKNRAPEDVYIPRMYGEAPAAKPADQKDSLLAKQELFLPQPEPSPPRATPVNDIPSVPEVPIPVDMPEALPNVTYTQPIGDVQSPIAIAMPVAQPSESRVNVELPSIPDAVVSDEQVDAPAMPQLFPEDNIPNTSLAESSSDDGNQMVDVMRDLIYVIEELKESIGDMNGQGAPGSVGDTLGPIGGDR